MKKLNLENFKVQKIQKLKSIKGGGDPQITQSQTMGSDVDQGTRVVGDGWYYDKDELVMHYF